MGCGCPFATAEALRASPPRPGRRPRARARVALDRRALRLLLRSRAEVVEALAAQASGAGPKATGRPTANVSVLWRYYTSSVYRSGDLPAIATREALQNAVDAVRAAARDRQIAPGAGRFDVTWDGAMRTLAFADNGVGMSARDVLDRFLSLGTSGKAGAASSDDAAGGFGVAKAVILGTSETFRWEMHTRDNRVESPGEDRDVEIFDLDPPIQGTVLRIFDVPPRLAERRWDRATGAFRSIEERILDVLGACDLDDVALRFNGAPVKRLFDRKRGSRLAAGAAWGAGTTARVRGHRRPPGDRQGGYWIRLGGLFQFREPSRRGDLPADVVIDLTTTVRPGQEGYPLNAARDALQGEAAERFEELVQEVEQENESAGHDHDDEIIDPDSSDEAERAAAATLAELTAEAFDDPTFRRALAEAAGGLRDLYDVEAAGGAKVDPGSSTAPPSTAVVRVPVDAAPPGTPEVIRKFLGDADARRQGLSPDGGPILTVQVRAALDHAEAKGQLDDAGRQVVDAAIVAAVGAAQDAGGGGLAQLLSLPRVEAALVALSPAVEVPARPRNPFGALAGLRISRKHYDRRRARRFQQRWAKWLPHLTVWDSTLRMIAAEARIRRRFKPGWVLDDEVVGLATAAHGKTPVIHLHPDRLAEVLEAHRQRPLAVAAFLHGVGCHELTHLDGRMGRGHDEAFVSAREALGRATAHLLPAIAVLVEKVLGVRHPPSAEVQAVAKLERQVARLKGKAKEDRAAREGLARAQATLERCRGAVAEAEARSAQVRAEQTARCRCEATPPEPGRATPQASPFPEVGLREALVAWNPHLVVYAVAGELLKRPPPGLDRAYIEGFVRRNEDALVEVIGRRMGWGR